MTNKKQSTATSDDGKDITLLDVINHMENHFQRIDRRFDQVDQRFDELAGEIAEVRKEIAEFRAEFREFAKGVDDLDLRMQTIEEENLPKRLQHVEGQLSAAG